MNDASTEAIVSSTTQAAENSEVISAACPLANFSPEAHQYIHSLENHIASLVARVTKLEEENQKSRERTIAFGKSLYQNPMTKMFLSSAPKELQTRIKEFFDGN